MGLIRILKKIVFHVKFRRANSFQKAEMMRPYFYHLGKNVRLYTSHFGGNPEHISIEDNVLVAADVKFITHDMSVFNIARYAGVPESSVDGIGSIILGDNCFIGAYSLLMPNCSVGRNSVIAAGSIVTKHVPDNEVWGGVPASFIMTCDDYAKKIIERSSHYPWLSVKSPMSEQDRIRIRQEYLFGQKTTKIEL